ncbi:Branched-chain-amino-acid aminotransferase, partial [Gonioctena quinquepunctata]
KDNIFICSKLLEFFGAGTACVITPVSSIEYLGEVISIPTKEQAKPLYKTLRDYLSAIQYGHIAHPWAVVIE